MLTEGLPQALPGVRTKCAVPHQPPTSFCLLFREGWGPHLEGTLPPSRRGRLPAASAGAISNTGLEERCEEEWKDVGVRDWGCHWGEGQPWPAGGQSGEESGSAQAPPPPLSSAAGTLRPWAAAAVSPGQAWLPWEARPRELSVSLDGSRLPSEDRPLGLQVQ